MQLTLHIVLLSLAGWRLAGAALHDDHRLQAREAYDSPFKAKAQSPALQRQKSHLTSQPSLNQQGSQSLRTSVKKPATKTDSQQVARTSVEKQTEPSRKFGFANRLGTADVGTIARFKSIYHKDGPKRESKSSRILPTRNSQSLKSQDQKAEARSKSDPGRRLSSSVRNFFGTTDNSNAEKAASQSISHTDMKQHVLEHQSLRNIFLKAESREKPASEITDDDFEVKPIPMTSYDRKTLHGKR